MLDCRVRRVQALPLDAQGEHHTLRYPVVVVP